MAPNLRNRLRSSWPASTNMQPSRLARGRLVTVNGSGVPIIPPPRRNQQELPGFHQNAQVQINQPPDRGQPAVAGNDNNPPPPPVVVEPAGAGINDIPPPPPAPPPPPPPVEPVGPNIVDPQNVGVRNNNEVRNGPQHPNGAYVFQGQEINFPQLVNEGNIQQYQNIRQHQLENVHRPAGNVEMGYYERLHMNNGHPYYPAAQRQRIPNFYYEYNGNLGNHLAARINQPIQEFPNGNWQFPENEDDDVYVEFQDVNNYGTNWRNVPHFNNGYHPDFPNTIEGCHRVIRNLKSAILKKNIKLNAFKDIFKKR